MNLFKIVSFVAFAAITFSPATAQSIGGTSPMDLNTISSAGLSARIGNLSIAKTSRTAAARSRHSASFSPVGAAFSAPSAFSGQRMVSPGPASLSYRPDLGLRAQVRKEFIGRVARKNPDAARAISNIDFFREYGPLVASNGYKPNNVADALASYLAIGWMISQGRVIDMNEPGQRIVRARIATMLSQDPSFQDAKMRQRVGDELQILTVIIAGGFKSAMADSAAATRAYGDDAARMLQKTAGQDLRRWALTAEGFVQRSANCGAGRVAVLPGRLRRQ